MKARTMFCVAVFIIAGFGLLIYQLYALQLRDAELYRTEAVTQQMKDITLPALRGSIYSVNGKLLAKSNTVWNIVADPSSIAKSGATEAQLRTAAQGLADLLGDGTTADALAALGISIDKTLADNDAYHALKACGGLIVTGPTGTNVNDITVLLVCPPPPLPILPISQRTPGVLVCTRAPGVSAAPRFDLQEPLFRGGVQSS